eukprot:scaffold11946_cov19-Tisochrysis_lutea.AAC.4
MTASTPTANICSHMAPPGGQPDAGAAPTAGAAGAAAVRLPLRAHTSTTNSKGNSVSSGG